MDRKHFSHKHLLKFNEETTHEGDEKVYCSGCGELVSGPSFRCVACRFYLDKSCAEAPRRLNHPFHSKHSLRLLKRHRYGSSSSDECICSFCDKSCGNFVYHCSCEIDLHVRCALFSYNLAEKRVGELQHIAHIDPLISTENHKKELKEVNCFVCLRPLLDSVYFSPDCGFYLHVKCADHPVEINHLFHPQHPLTLDCLHQGNFSCKICKQEKSRGFFYQCSACDFFLHVECATLPTTINHLCHRKHPLNLQFIGGDLPCQMCQQTIHEGCAYCCSICNFALHIECAPPPIVEDKSHQHHFIPVWKPNVSFICDACGNPGKFISYNCSTCNIMVHKKCISLPRTLNHPKHFEHPILHTHLLGLDQEEIEAWECQICHLEELNAKHARYRCSDCNYNVHVSCAIEDYGWYEFDESGKIDNNLEENSASLLSYIVIKETKQGENVVATEIEHFSHKHCLTLSNDIRDDKYCDGCVQCISAPYYDCSQCNFSLHKSCAELPMKKSLWFHIHPEPVPLTSGCIFKCRLCNYKISGFAYACHRCSNRYCLPCALVSPIYKSEVHEHRLSFNKYFEDLCNACGGSLKSSHKCKACKLTLHWDCMNLPLKARHTSHKHPLILTTHDDNHYSESHYCDICEEERNPKHWFYHCATCDTSAHRRCALGPYPFIKLGSIYEEWNGHPHPLTFVQKDYYYPKCYRCRRPCLSLSLECKETACSGYIVCWNCVELINKLNAREREKYSKEDEEEDEEEEEEDEEEEEEEEEE